jgi:hypothetical protein
MNIRRLLSNLFSFVTDLRGSGTTTLIKKVASENDVWVLVPNQQVKKDFGESGVTFDELDRIKGCKPKPILLDNYTLLQLSELSLNEYERLDLMIKKRNRLIRTIRDEILLFERENGQGFFENEM